jgi:hypothetical protein
VDDPRGEQLELDVVVGEQQEVARRFAGAVVPGEGGAAGAALNDDLVRPGVRPREVDRGRGIPRGDDNTQRRADDNG